MRWSFSYEKYSFCIGFRHLWFLYEQDGELVTEIYFGPWRWRFFHAPES